MTMVIRSASFVKGATTLAGMPDDGRPEVAFVGRSNVGKSSLLNMILGRKKLARTSGSPGKTREVNFFLINDALYFVDLPGLGYARVSRSSRSEWQRLIGAYVTSRPTLNTVFQLIDARHPPTGLDREAALLMRDSEAHHVVLLTKVDKLSGTVRIRAERQTSEALAALGMEVPIIPTSARTGYGRREVLKWLETFSVQRRRP